MATRASARTGGSKALTIRRPCSRRRVVRNCRSAANADISLSCFPSLHQFQIRTRWSPDFGSAQAGVSRQGAPACAFISSFAPPTLDQHRRPHAGQQSLDRRVGRQSPAWGRKAEGSARWTKTMRLAALPGCRAFHKSYAICIDSQDSAETPRHVARMCHNRWGASLRAYGSPAGSAGRSLAMPRIPLETGRVIPADDERVSRCYLNSSTEA